MNCNNILELIVDYYDDILDENIRSSIDNHLSQCSNCRAEFDDYFYTINSVKKSRTKKYKGVTATDNFDQLMYSALEGEVRKPSKKLAGWRRLTAVSAVVIVAVVVTAFTPVLATIQGGIASIIDFAFGDRGIIISLEKGLGQPIEKSTLNKDIEFKVHSLISDEIRTVLLVSFDYRGMLYEVPDDMTIFGTRVTDKSGKPLTNGYSSSLRFDKDNNRLTGNINLGKVDSKHKKANIAFDAVALYKRETIEIPISIGIVPMANINMRIDIDNEMIEAVIVKSIRLDQDILTIDYDIVYTDSQYAIGLASMQLLTSEEGLYSSNIGRSSSRIDTRINSTQDIFSIVRQDIDKYNLVFNYPRPIKIVDSKWNIAFDIDRSTSKNNTLTLNPNKSFTVGNHEMTITKIVFTPSATTLTIESLGVSPLAVLSNTYLKNDDTSFVWSSSGSHNSMISSSNPNERFSAQYQFEPLFSTDGITLVIKGAIVPEKVEIELDLTPDNSGTKQSFTIDGREILVEYEYLTDSMLEIRVEQPGFTFQNRIDIVPDSIYVLNSLGEKLESQDRPTSSLAWGFNTTGITFVHRDIKDFTTLRIDAVSRYQDMDMEIRVID